MVITMKKNEFTMYLFIQILEMYVCVASTIIQNRVEPSDVL